MKRVKKSGAEYRKKKAKKEADAKKSQGALLKYFDSSSGSKTTLTPSAASSSSGNDFNAEEEDDDVSVVEVRSRSGPTTEHGQDEIDSSEVPQASSQKFAKEVNLDLDVAKKNVIETVPFAPSEAKDVNVDDVGCWPSTMTDDVRTLIVRRGSDSVQHIDSKFADVVRSGTLTKGGIRKLTREWFYKLLSNGEKVLRTWMVYSPLKQSLYCFCCKLFGNSNSGTNFESEEGFNKWWKLNPKIGDHENSLDHEQSFLKWKELEVRLNRKATIDQKQQEVFEMENRDRFVQAAIDFAKTLCEKLGIELKTTRIRRKKRIHGDESADAALSHEQELRREVTRLLKK
ncbi:zinc finger MYM-type protein 5-like [Photinus pyralis]|uniref:zinc finger MYM-type protein 5-like n=1 Tax=Photinus pyralis TaxID=7054 RepID=UPI00126727C6|nr:zinc finger MYM-type protein 5-like [Photinus pyralis]